MTFRLRSMSIDMFVEIASLEKWFIKTKEGHGF